MITAETDECIAEGLRRMIERHARGTTPRDANGRGASLAVLTSAIETDECLADGRRRVVERHTFTDGSILRIPYVAELGTDVAAVMSARLPLLNVQIAALAEVELRVRAELAARGW